MSDNHNIAVFEWQKKPDQKKGIDPVFASGKGTPAAIMSLVFDPQE